MDKFVIRSEEREKSPAAAISGIEVGIEPLMSTAKKRKICSSWLDDFSEWLVKNTNVSGENELCCKISQCILKVSSGNADLERHKATKKHSERARVIQNQKTLDQCFESSNVELQSVQKMELQLCAFIAEHNLPFSCMDHLSIFMKNCIPDSKIARKISCGRTKTTNLVKNVLGRTQSEYVCNLLRKQKFSLCVDESTDISNEKSLCLVVRICIDFHVEDLFFALIAVDGSDALSLYNCIVEHFKKINIPYKNNMIGFAADGAANMTGKNFLLAKLLKDDILNLFVLKRICHSIALCSSCACLKLPSSVESLVRDVYNYISNSSKRSAQFLKVSTLLEYKPKKILHPAQTRWLSLELVVNRVLELYEPLKIFFSLANNIDHIDSAGIISNNLNDCNELYLSFLKYILHVVNNVNKVFQSKSSQIQNMYAEMFRLYLKVLHNFIKPEYLDMKKVFELNLEDHEKFLKTEEIYLGIYMREKLIECQLPEDVKCEFVNNCTAFYVELCKQINNRFDFHNRILEERSFIDPKKAMKPNMDSLQNLMKNFQNLIKNENMQDLDDEFRELRLIIFVEFFDNVDTISAEEFWKTIATIKLADSVRVFPILSHFVSNLMSLPCSSANVERIFSKVNLNKTKFRNRLDNVTLEGILFIQDYLLTQKCSCYDLKIEKSVIKNCKPSEYNVK